MPQFQKVPASWIHNVAHPHEVGEPRAILNLVGKPHDQRVSIFLGKEVH